MNIFLWAAVLLLLGSRVFAEADLPVQWKMKSTAQISAADSPVAYYRKVITAHRDVDLHLHLLVLDPRKCTLRVIDDPNGAGKLAATMQANGCLAGVNGGYFHPDRVPLGLVIADGKRIHSFQRAKLLSGILAVTDKRVSLIRSAKFNPGEKIQQALQAGPFLIDAGQIVTGLDTQRRARRTVVLVDRAGNCALLVSEPVTLNEMARILASENVMTEIKPVRALNLDGGSSTGLWVKAEPTPFSLPERSYVRNYLAVVPK